MSLNDPRWGKSPEENDKSEHSPNNNDDEQQPRQNQGDDNKKRPNRNEPPDLDEAWDDLVGKINGWLNQNNTKAKMKKNPWKGILDENGGGAGNNGGGGFSNSLAPMASGKFLTLAAVLAVILWLLSGFYVVDASERGVVLQFGRFLKSTEPGLNWRLPAPIQTHEIVDLTNVRTIEVGYRGSEKNKVLKEALMLTDDENLVNIQFAVQYILKDPMEYLFYNRDTDAAVKGAAESAFREIVGKSKMDLVLYEGREQIAADATQLIQEILDRYQSGVLISKVTMQNAQPPEQVQAAFDDAVTASQDKERQKNEGQAYANDVIPKARGTASRLMEEAQAYRQSVVAKAQGDVARFSAVLDAYKAAPEVTRERLYLETMQQIYANTSKVMVDQKAGGNSLLYLPLEKLLEKPQEKNRSTMENKIENSMPMLEKTESSTRNLSLTRNRGER